MAGGAVGVSSYMAVAYDAATGAEEWVAHHGGYATDAAQRGTAMSPDGSTLFLTGGELGTYTTVAYDT